jgi:hypothetical protein
MADVKHLNQVAVHCKEDPIDVRLAAVQELADLYRRIATLGRHATAQGTFR